MRRAGRAVGADGANAADDDGEEEWVQPEPEEQRRLRTEADRQYGVGEWPRAAPPRGSLQPPTAAQIQTHGLPSLLLP